MSRSLTHRLLTGHVSARISSREVGLDSFARLTGATEGGLFVDHGVRMW